MTDEITFTLTPAKARVVASLCQLARKTIRAEVDRDPVGAAQFARAFANADLSDNMRAIDEVTDLFLARTTKLSPGQRIYNDAGPESVEA